MISGIVAEDLFVGGAVCCVGVGELWLSNFI